MRVAYKNFWSLNIDEAIVSGILRNETATNAVCWAYQYVFID